MIRKFLFALMGVMLSLNLAWAATDANTASKEDLDQVKGIGPAIAQKIVDERQKNGPFKSLDDLQKRVSGIGETSVKKLAANGLTVGGGSSAGTNPGKDVKSTETKDQGPDAKAKGKSKKAEKAEAAATKDDKPAADAKPAKAEKGKKAKADKAESTDNAASAADGKKSKKAKKEAAASAAKP